MMSLGIRYHLSCFNYSRMSLIKSLHVISQPSVIPPEMFQMLATGLLHFSHGDHIERCIVPLKYGIRISTKIICGWDLHHYT